MWSILKEVSLAIEKMFLVHGIFCKYLYIWSVIKLNSRVPLLAFSLVHQCRYENVVLKLATIIVSGSTWLFVSISVSFVKLRAPVFGTWTFAIVISFWWTVLFDKTQWLYFSWLVFICSLLYQTTADTQSVSFLYLVEFPFFDYRRVSSLVRCFLETKESCYLFLNPFK